MISASYLFFFFFNDTAPTEFSPLPLPDVLPICPRLTVRGAGHVRARAPDQDTVSCAVMTGDQWLATGRCDRYGCSRSEEHTSELQSHSDLVCRLLLEKKKNEKR